MAKKKQSNIISNMIIEDIDKHIKYGINIKEFNNEIHKILTDFIKKELK